jgi:hypothetical protein
MGEVEVRVFGKRGWIRVVALEQLVAEPSVGARALHESGPNAAGPLVARRDEQQIAEMVDQGHCVARPVARAVHAHAFLESRRQPDVRLIAREADAQRGRIQAGQRLPDVVVVWQRRDIEELLGR